MPLPAKKQFFFLGTGLAHPQMPLPAYPTSLPKHAFWIRLCDTRFMSMCITTEWPQHMEYRISTDQQVGRCCQTGCDPVICLLDNLRDVSSCLC